jgi:hypothetical protein
MSKATGRSVANLPSRITSVMSTGPMAQIRALPTRIRVRPTARPVRNMTLSGANFSACSASGSIRQVIPSAVAERTDRPPPPPGPRSAGMSRPGSAPPASSAGRPRWRGRRRAAAPAAHWVCRWYRPAGAGHRRPHRADTEGSRSRWLVRRVVRGVPDFEKNAEPSMSRHCRCGRPPFVMVVTNRRRHHGGRSS